MTASMALVFVIGVILTGANRDGARGLAKIKSRGGLTVVQQPASAACGEMPQAAIDLTEVDWILPLQEIAPCLDRLRNSGTYGLPAPGCGSVTEHYGI